MDCFCCGVLIRTRYWYVLSISSADEEYVSVLCAVCWSDLFASKSTRELRTYSRQLQLPR